MKYCQICDKELNDTDEFCIYCGMKYKEEKNSAVIKKVYLIIVLSALAVGVVGMGLFVSLNHTKKNEQIDNNISANDVTGKDKTTQDFQDVYI